MSTYLGVYVSCTTTGFINSRQQCVQKLENKLLTDRKNNNKICVL